MTIEIVDFPMKNVIFHSYVKLPEFMVSENGKKKKEKILENDDHADLGVRISDMLQAIGVLGTKLGIVCLSHEKVHREQIENTRMCMETY